MFARVVGLLGLLLLGGCASHGTGEPVAGFEAAASAVEAPMPTVGAEGTAVAGWLSSTNREPDDTTAIVDELVSTGPYRLDSGDKLRIFVYAQPSLSRIYTVDNEGFISVPLIGNILARGATTRGLEAVITARLGSQFVRDPHVTVDIQQQRPFFILGEVKTAGQYPYVGGLTVDAAVAIAGGYSERADERKVQIMRRMKTGVVKLVVPGETEVRPGDTIYVKERWF